MKNIFCLVIIIFTFKLGFACKCVNENTLKEEFTATEIIFNGVVISKSLICVKETMTSSKADLLEKEIISKKDLNKFLNQELIYEVKLKISEVYKGVKTQKIITIFTAIHSGACGYRAFKIGKEFIVYASSKSYLYHKFNSFGVINLEKENTFWTNHCTKTKEFNKEEAQQLQKLTKK